MEKLTNKQLAAAMKKHLGKRVKMIKGKHIEEKGFTNRIYFKGSKPVMMVKLDSGVECEANHDEILFLVMEEGRSVGEFPDDIIATDEVKEQINIAKEIIKTTEKHNSQFN